MVFTDRVKELDLLHRALHKDRPVFIVIYGRRRLGKSTLVKRILENRDVYFMADQTEAINQRRLFASTIAALFPRFDEVEYPSWESLLNALNSRCQERMTVCIDEFPYLAKSEDSLPSVLQKMIDSRTLKFNLIVCGSSQQMMYEMALNESSPLYGRADEIVRLSPIPVRYMPEALGISAKQAVEEYAIWGGVPRYWELREECQSLDEAIEHLCISQFALLYDEVSHILRDDMRDLVQASTLLSVIGNGANKVSEIASRVNKDSSSLAGPLKKLLKMQLVEREVPFGENLKDSKRSLYHLSDPYMQFYYRFISSNRSFIELGRTEMVMNIIRAEKATYVGYMWERLARRSVSGQTIEGITFGMASRWWGGVSKSESIELDVIAESLDKKTLLVGECKWTSAEDASRLEHNLITRAEKLPFFHKYESVLYVLFLREKPIVKPTCRVFLPVDVIGMC